MGGTITTAIDYAIKLGCKDILLIADNTVHSKDFQDCVNTGIIELAKHCNLYKWTKDGNFPIPYKKYKGLYLMQTFLQIAQTISYMPNSELSTINGIADITNEERNAINEGIKDGLEREF